MNKVDTDMSKPDIPATVADLVAVLDQLAHADNCVFPEDVITAANAHIGQVGQWAAADVAQQYKGTRGVLAHYLDAYRCGDDIAKQVYARAILKVWGA